MCPVWMGTCGERLLVEMDTVLFVSDTGLERLSLSEQAHLGADPER